MTEVLSREDIDQLLKPVSVDKPFWKRVSDSLRKVRLRFSCYLKGKWKKYRYRLLVKINRHGPYYSNHSSSGEFSLGDFGDVFRFGDDPIQHKRTVFRWGDVSIYRRYFSSLNGTCPIHISDEEFRNILSLEDVLRERKKDSSCNRGSYLKVFHKLKVGQGTKALYSELAVDYPVDYSCLSETEVIQKLKDWYNREFGNDSELFSQEENTLKVCRKKTILYWDTFLGDRVNGLASCPEELWPSIISHTSMKDLDRMLRAKRHIRVLNGFDFSR